jgi:hypothetical protein
MEGVLAHIQALSGSTSDLAQLSSQLKASPLISHAPHIPACVDALEPESHALGQMYLL